MPVVKMTGEMEVRGVVETSVSLSWPPGPHVLDVSLFRVYSQHMGSGQIWTDKTRVVHNGEGEALHGL